MAILQKDSHLGVEVIIKKSKFESFYDYSFRFFYGEHPLFNPNIMGTEKIKTDDYGETLISTIEELLKTNTPQSWDALEYDFELTINPYPEMGFRQAEQNKNLVYISETEKQKLLEVDAKRAKNNGLLEEDYFEFSFFFNTLNLIKLPDVEDTRSQGEIGPGVKLFVSRKIVEKFLSDLRKELNTEA